MWDLNKDEREQLNNFFKMYCEDNRIPANHEIINKLKKYEEVLKEHNDVLREYNDAFKEYNNVLKKYNNEINRNLNNSQKRNKIILEAIIMIKNGDYDDDALMSMLINSILLN